MRRSTNQKLENQKQTPANRANNNKKEPAESTARVSGTFSTSDNIILFT